MTDYTRVRDTRTGHEYSVTTAVAAADDNLTPLDTPAIDVNGSPLAPKCSDPASDPIPHIQAPASGGWATTIPHRGAEQEEKKL